MHNKNACPPIVNYVCMHCCIMHRLTTLFYRDCQPAVRSVLFFFSLLKFKKRDWLLTSQSLSVFPLALILKTLDGISSARSSKILLQCMLKRTPGRKPQYAQNTRKSKKYFNINRFSEAFSKTQNECKYPNENKNCRPDFFSRLMKTCTTFQSNQAVLTFLEVSIHDFSCHLTKTQWTFPKSKAWLRLPVI